MPVKDPPPPSQPVDEQVLSQHLARAGEHLRADRLDNATDEIKTALALNPGDLRTRNLLGLLHFRSGRFDDALGVYRELLLEREDDTALRLNLGLVELRMGHFAEAVEHLGKVVEAEPDNTRAQGYYGLALMRSGELGRARQILKRAGQDELVRQVDKMLANQPIPPPPVAASGTLTTTGEHAAVTEQPGDQAAPQAVPQQMDRQADRNLGRTTPLRVRGHAPVQPPPIPAGAQPAPETRSATRQEPRPAARPEPRYETKLETKINTKPYAKIDPEVEPASKTEPTVKVRPAARMEATRARQETRSNPPPATQQDAPTAAQQDESAAAKHDESAAAKHDESAAAKHDESAAVQHDAPAAVQHDAPAAVQHDAPAAAKHDAPAAVRHDEHAATNHDAPVATQHAAPAAVQHAAPAAVRHDAPTAQQHDAPAAQQHDAPAPRQAEAEQNLLRAQTVSFPPEDIGSPASFQSQEAAVQPHHADAPAEVAQEDSAETRFEMPDDLLDRAGRQAMDQARSAADAGGQALEAEQPFSPIEPIAADIPRRETDWQMRPASQGLPAPSPSSRSPLRPIPIPVPHKRTLTQPLLGAQQAQPLLAFARSRELGPSADGGAFGITEDGLLVVRIAGLLPTRSIGVVVSTGELAFEPLSRRARGRTLAEPFGEGAFGLFRASGHGMMVISPRGGHFLALSLHEESVYLRESATFSFEDGLHFENGRLPGAGPAPSHGYPGLPDELGRVVQFRGSGQLVVRTDRPLFTVRLTAGQTSFIEVEHLIGWMGRIIPSLLTEEGGAPTPYVECSGEGFLLVEPPPKEGMPLPIAAGPPVGDGSLDQRKDPRR